ncbi:hypothetical protein [Lyngbya sp. CCY1209]|uniref:hypothetical protein n=1 Tax=Lyngbya sp. CCY1209 TaxID=2886103 RepID=UPI002D214648|nr:hypothetical protein [Lyngbya sp. CCY1209]MEB3884100.1 hypothetical protein [Lyngbya sp. CCY1209]
MRSHPDISGIRTSAGMFWTETIVLFEVATLRPGSDGRGRLGRNGGGGSCRDRDR